jgi:predicted DNA-binding transcriptional regulator YafY
MQINRLFEIVYSLLNKKTTTAKELSERFEDFEEYQNNSADMENQEIHIYIALND